MVVSPCSSSGGVGDRRQARACTSRRPSPPRRWSPCWIAAAPLEAAGGMLLLVGTLALGRFALATAALDTGSPFGGMGASRDMTIAALAEPALMLGLFTSALAAGSLNLGELVRNVLQRGATIHPSDLLAFAGLFIIVIAETGRIPVDNPATHLELTMIHEAMVLEYAGPDLALVEWASAFKELLYLTLLVDLFMPAGIATSARTRCDRRRPDGVGRQGPAAGDRRDGRREHERQAAAVPRPRARVHLAGARVSGAGDPIPVRPMSAQNSNEARRPGRPAENYPTLFRRFEASS